MLNLISRVACVPQVSERISAACDKLVEQLSSVTILVDLAVRGAGDCVCLCRNAWNLMNQTLL